MMKTNRKLRTCTMFLGFALMLCVCINLLMPTTYTVKANDFYSPVFNVSYYASHNPDLAAAGITSESALLNHFVNFGMSEGRQGSEEFNVFAYMNRYPDLKAAFGNDLKLYYLHYINNGAAEGRNGRAEAAITAPSAPAVTTPAASGNTKYTTPLYTVYNETGSGWGSWLTVRAGQSNGSWAASQSLIDKANANPSGRTEGYSELTGYARIGDIRYLNFSNTEVRMKMNGLSQISYKMECYAVNANGVPLFRRYGSYFNVYTQATNLVPFIDAITPSMTVYDVQKIAGNYITGYSSCTASANAYSTVLGQVLIENYHLMSDAINHEETLIYIGGGQFIWGRYAQTCTVDTLVYGRGSQGTFYVNHYSVK